MSVLFGCVDFTGQPFEPSLETALFHAAEGIVGDETSTFSQPGILLGIVRQHLQTYPASGFSNNISDVLIVADARLDNREELGAQLGIPPVGLQDTRDDALILLGYKKWGERLPEKLLGDFAFVIHDGKKRRLFCARDPIGIRPFYYAFIKGRFFFNTLLNRMARMLPLSLTPNDRVIVGSFISSFWFPGETVAAEIQKLEGGYSLSLGEKTSPVIRQYHKLCVPDPIRLKSDNDYAAELRQRLEQAVRSRTRSERPVAAHLSCGLDSATVAILAARQRTQQGDRLYAISWNPDFATIPAVKGDERNVICDISKNENLVHCFAPFDPQGLSAVMDKVPYLSGGLYNQRHHYTLSWLQDAGVRSLITGLGGDEFASFNGRGYFAQLLAHGRWLRFFADANRLIGSGAVPRGQIRSEIFALIPASLQRRLKKDRQLHAFQRPLLRREFTDIIQGINASRPLDISIDVKDWQIRKARHYHSARLERDAECADVYGIRHLSPLLDLRVIEFLLAIPTEQHLKEGWHRSLMRRATRGILPEDIRQRRSKNEPSMDLLNQRYQDCTHSLLEDRFHSIHASSIFRRYLNRNTFDAFYAQKQDPLSSLLIQRASLNVLGLQTFLYGEL